MIKATELRIGNYILCLNELYVVDGIKYEPNAPSSKWRINFRTLGSNNAGMVLRSGKMENWICPIPLTPEWLGGFGFVDPANNGWGLRLSVSAMEELVWYRQDGPEFNGTYHSVRYQSKGPGITRDLGIKYIHQLQNLFYCLTGEELTIKETV